jgi:predicted phage baseplate assembly protein
VIDDSIRVTVREGESDVGWTRVETLLFSGPGDRHYQVRRDELERASLEFGTGTQGMVPPYGVDNVRASYLVGGGSRGNVAPGAIVKLGELAGAIPGLKRVGHDEPASGGADREALDVAVLRAPYQFRSQDRAVTAADYEAHALAFGVDKARAFMGAWNRLELVVAPAGGGLPSKTLKEQLLRYVDERRVMTTIVEVKDPAYVRVNVELLLTVDPAYFTEQVRSAAEGAIRALLTFDAVDFGHVLYVSKLYEAVEALDGVRGLVIRRFEAERDVVEPSLDGRLAFGDREIPILGELSCEANGGLRFG